MRNKFMKGLALLLTLTMIGASFAGCAKKDADPTVAATEAPTTKEAGTEGTTAADETTAASQETVNITWHRTCWHTNDDEKAVEDAINAYIEPKIGVTVTVLNDAENTALDLALAGGDDIDLFWCASWANLYNFIDGNSVYDLTDVLADYPELYASMPETVWESAKSAGRNYYVPVYKESANGQGLSVPTSLVEKYNWDLSAVKELKDIEPMLADCYADGMANPIALQDPTFDCFELDKFAFLTKYAGVARDGDTTKIVNIMETPEYKEFVDMMYSWNKAGYINQEESAPDSISTEIITEKRKNGENAFYRWAMTPDSKANASSRFGMDVEIIPLTGSYVETDSAAGSAYAINAKTTKLDACMKFLQLLNTDETLANLAAFGIEGEHYTKTADGRVTLIPESGYAYPGVWIVCNVNAPSLLDNESADKKEQYDAFNKEAEVSCTAGFRFDKTAVEAEVTALDGVLAEYQALLEKGFYDPEEYLPEFQAALKTAGVEKVIAEMQTQYDAWLAVK